jgi:anti-anti-sigma regulatory factor
MAGRETEPQVHFTRIPCNDPEVTVFGISGSLGPRARPYLERLIQECLRREMPRMVLDLSDVDSLGGGSARLLNEFAQRRAKGGDATVFRVISPTVRGFLRSGPTESAPILSTMSEAIAAVKKLSDKVPNAGADGEFPESEWRNRDSLVTLGELFGEPQLSPPLLAETPGRGDAAPEARGSRNGRSRQPELSQSNGRESVDTTASELQQQVVRVLRDRSLASRAWVFILLVDDYYYMVAANGTVFDRAFARVGELVRRVRDRSSASLLLDL